LRPLLGAAFAASPSRPFQLFKEDFVMRVYTPLVLLAGVLLAADDDREEAIKNGLKQLAGTWSIVSVETDGKAQQDEDLKYQKMVVRGDRYTVRKGDQVIEEGLLKIDPTKKPKWIDVTPTSGESKGNSFQGIYEVEGDTARDCFALPGKPRPTDFSTKRGSDRFLRVYKRDKP
jgi:uncharacterized protein (TIGR03067 family)